VSLPGSFSIQATHTRDMRVSPCPRSHGQRRTEGQLCAARQGAVIWDAAEDRNGWSLSRTNGVRAGRGVLRFQ
jgi:hypothetical protein